jgi:hypothetical protein
VIKVPTVFTTVDELASAGRTIPAVVDGGEFSIWEKGVEGGRDFWVTWNQGGRYDFELCLLRRWRTFEARDGL